VNSEAERTQAQPSQAQPTGAARQHAAKCGVAADSNQAQRGTAKFSRQASKAWWGWRATPSPAKPSQAQPRGKVRPRLGAA